MTLMHNPISDDTERNQPSGFCDLTELPFTRDLSRLVDLEQHIQDLITDALIYQQTRN